MSLQAALGLTQRCQEVAEAAPWGVTGELFSTVPLKNDRKARESRAGTRIQRKSRQVHIEGTHARQQFLDRFAQELDVCEPLGQLRESERRRIRYWRTRITADCKPFGGPDARDAAGRRY